MAEEKFQTTNLGGPGEDDAAVTIKSGKKKTKEDKMNDLKKEAEMVSLVICKTAKLKYFTIAWRSANQPSSNW